MAPINFGLPGFFKANLSSVDCGWSVYTPFSDTTNLELHIQADHDVFTNNGVTCASDTEAIQQINSQDGSGITARQTVEAEKPTYAVDSLNGNNTIYFTESTLNLSSDVNLGTQFTIHMLFKKDDTTDKFALGHGGTSGTLIGNWSDTNFYVFSDVGNGFYVPVGHITDYSIMSVTRDGVSNKGVVYENGLIHGIRNSITSPSSDTTINLIGDRKGGDGKGDTNLADLTMYSSIKTPTEISTLLNELNTRYSIYPTYGSAPTPPVIAGSTLEHYLNVDYDVYSDMGKTVVSNNDSVRTFRAQHNNHGHAYQHTGSKQLIYHNTVLGSNGSLYKGGGDYMDLSEEINFTNAESFVVYSVHKRGNNGNNGIYFKQGVTKDSILDHASGTCYFFDSVTSTSVVAGWSTNTVIRAYVVDRNANLFRVYENGVELGTSSTAALTGTVKFNAMFNWGSGTALTGLMEFGDHLLYRGLHDATKVGTVDDFLNKKYNVHSYLTQQGGTLPVTSNLLLRIEGNAGVYSDAGTTPVIDTDSIRQVDDFSSNSNDLDQSTASKQLTYETNHFNRKDFIKHLPGDYLSPTTSFNLSGGTVYVTGKKALENSDWWFIGGDNNACMGNFSSGLMSVYDGTNYNTLSTGQFTQHAVYAIVWDFGNTYEVFENGVSLGTANVSNVGPINNVKVFGRGSETGASVNYFGDLLLYSDVHTSTQVEQISDYLSELRYEVDSYTKEPTYKKFLLHHFEAGSSSLKTNNFSPVSGDTIQIVNDLTHNNNNGTVSSTAPTYHSSGVDINNKPYIQLGGGSGVVNLDESLTFERTQDWTIFAVVKKDTASDVLTLYGGPINNAFFSDYSDGKMYFVSPGHATDFSSMGTDWCIISAVYDASANTINVYKNGTLLGTDTTWNIGSNYTIDRLFNRGNTITTSGSYVAECMLYGTKLSSTEIAAEESRLNTKYDIY